MSDKAQQALEAIAQLLEQIREHDAYIQVCLKRQDPSKFHAEYLRSRAGAWAFAPKETKGGPGWFDHAEEARYRFTAQALEILREAKGALDKARVHILGGQFVQAYEAVVKVVHFFPQEHKEILENIRYG